MDTTTSVSINSKQSESEYKNYLSGLEKQVEQYKQMNPEKYHKAQSIGESYMNCKYDMEIGEDYEGDLYHVNRLFNIIKSYNLQDEDLSTSELQLLNKKYGQNWREFLNDF